MPRTSHRFIFRLLLGQMALAILLSLPLTAKAQFQWEEGSNYGNGYGSQMGQGRIVRQPVNRHFSHRSLIDIERELNLPFDSEIISLSVTAQAITRQGGALQLLENGRMSGSPVRLSSLMSSVPLMLPYGSQSRLELEVQGDVFIQEIVAEVSDRWNPGPGPAPGPGPGPGGRAVRLDLNRRVNGIEQIRVLQLAQQQGHRLQGMELERLVIEARPMGYSRAEARLIINGIAGQFKDLSNQRTPFQLEREFGSRSEIGRDIRSLQVEIRGQVIVDSITLRTQDGMGPGFGRELHLRPMRDFHGRSSQTLEQALNLPIEHSSRLVSSIRLLASTQSQGGLAIVDIGRGPLERLTLDRFGRETVIHLPQPIPLRDIGINMTGHVRIETLSIQFLR